MLSSATPTGTVFPLGPTSPPAKKNPVVSENLFPQPRNCAWTAQETEVAQQVWCGHPTLDHSKKEMQFFSQDLIWATWDPRHTTNPKSENLLCSSHLLEPFFSSCLQSHWFPGALVSPSILVLSKCPHTRNYCTESCPPWSNHCQSNRARFCHPYSLCTTSNPIKRVSWCEELRRYFWTSSRSAGELWLTRWRSLLWKETLLCQRCSPWKLRPQAVHGSYSCSKAWL